MVPKYTLVGKRKARLLPPHTGLPTFPWGQTHHRITQGDGLAGGAKRNLSWTAPGHRGSRREIFSTDRTSMWRTMDTATSFFLNIFPSV